MDEARLSSRVMGVWPARAWLIPRALLVLGGLLLAGGCAPTWNSTQPRSEAGILADVTQLTTGFERADEACFSPDMNWIVFQAVPRGQREAQLYVAQLRWNRIEGQDASGIQRLERHIAGTFPPVRLSPDSSRNAGGAFSPDGNSLIFSSAAASSAAGSAAPPHEDQNPIAPPMELYRADGWQGAVAALEPGGAVNLARHPLTHNNVFDGQGVYSPDGRWIVFTSAREEGVGQLFVMEADGTHPLRLTHTSGYAGNAAFSPDGRKIAFRAQARPSGSLQIFVADVVLDPNRRIVGISSVRQVTERAMGVSKPSWHPDGKHLVYAMRRAELNDEELYLMRADGSHKTRLTLTRGRDGRPAFSPDGRWLIWTSGRTGDGSNQVFVANFTLPPGA